MAALAKHRGDANMDFFSGEVPAGVDTVDGMEQDDDVSRL
jgi:hypothetical protein